MSDLGFFGVLFVGQILLTLMAFIPTILGIIILCKYRKFWEFGVSLIISGIIGVYSESVKYMFLRQGVEFATRILVFASTAAAILAIASLVLKFLYAKRNYNAKGLPVVIAVPVGTSLLTRILTIYVSQAGVFKDNYIENVNMFNRITTVIGGLASLSVAIFIAVVFCKNKDKETDAPKLFVFITIIAVVSALGILSSISNIGIVSNIGNYISYGATSALGIYLLIAGKNAARKEIKESTEA